MKLWYKILLLLFCSMQTLSGTAELSAAEYNYSGVPGKKVRRHRHHHPKAVCYKSLQEALHNSILSAEEKHFLSQVLENVENSSIGRKVIAQLEEQFDFAFKFVQFPKTSTWGTYSPGLIKLNSNFLKGKCKHIKMHNLILCSSVVIHEMTHSVHRKNRIRLLSKNPSWEARIKDVMLRELHCRVNQFELSAELVNLLWTDEYRNNSHGHRFMAIREAAAWSGLVENRIDLGFSSEEAEAFARQALVKHLWRNAKDPEYVENLPIKFHIAKSWHKSYGPGSGRLPAVNGTGSINFRDAERLVRLIDGGVDYHWLMQNFAYICSRERIDAAAWCFREYWFPGKMQKNTGKTNP